MFLGSKKIYESFHKDFDMLQVIIYEIHRKFVLQEV